MHELHPSESRVLEKLDQLIAMSQAEQKYNLLLEKIDLLQKTIVDHQAALIGQHDEMLSLLRHIVAQGEKIMTALEEAKAAIKEIDDATTAQGLQLTALGVSNTEIGTDLDDLIAKLGNSVPAEVLTGLKAAATTVKAIGTNLTQHGEFAKNLAAKWPTQPPVPPPPPPPPPVP